MRTKRKFTPEYIREAVRLVLQENLSTPEAARRLEMSDKTLSNWCVEPGEASRWVDRPRMAPAKQSR